MNKTKSVFFILCSLIMASFWSAAGHAEDKASPELIAQGNELFNKKEGLGVKYACILCHKGDKAVKAADVAKAGEHLPAIMNKYITEKAKGPALAADSEQMKALIAYVRYEHAK